MNLIILTWPRELVLAAAPTLEANCFDSKTEWLCGILIDLPLTAH